jgi:hypothetical protein
MGEVFGRLVVGGSGPAAADCGRVRSSWSLLGRLAAGRPESDLIENTLMADLAERTENIITKRLGEGFAFPVGCGLREPDPQNDNISIFLGLVSFF